jgi:hypothetical protein
LANNMKRQTDITNKRFGRLFIVSQETEIISGRYRVFVTAWCDCGNEKRIRADGIKTGVVQSCGCLGIERRSESSAIACTTHGFTKGGRGNVKWTPEYRAWVGMKGRCFNEKYVKYSYWGGRGITVCDKWKDDFPAFLADMGGRPGPGYSIDRIDNNGNYEPGNCRWADAKTQRNNRRDSQKVCA